MPFSFSDDSIFPPSLAQLFEGMTLGSANAAVPAVSLIRSFNSDAMFPDVEQEREKKRISVT